MMSFYDCDSGLTLKSGRCLYANLGVLGIGPDASQITEGYDGTIGNDDLSAEEKAEIAAEMIRRWKQWGGIS